jgi:ABC-type sugar transport system permease subunit
MKLTTEQRRRASSGSNYRDLLADDHVWNNFSVTARYVLLSVGGQVLLEYGVALLLTAGSPSRACSLPPKKGPEVGSILSMP